MHLEMIVSGFRARPVFRFHRKHENEMSETCVCKVKLKVIKFKDQLQQSREVIFVPNFQIEYFSSSSTPTFDLSNIYCSTSARIANFMFTNSQRVDYLEKFVSTPTHSVFTILTFHLPKPPSRPWQMFDMLIQIF